MEFNNKISKDFYDIFTPKNTILTDNVIIKQTSCYAKNIDELKLNLDINSDNFIKNNIETLFNNISIYSYPKENVNIEDHEFELYNLYENRRKNHDSMNNLRQFFFGNYVFNYIDKKYLKDLNENDIKILKFSMYFSAILRINESTNKFNINHILYTEDLKKKYSFIIDNLIDKNVRIYQFSSTILFYLIIKQTNYKNDELLKLITLSYIIFRPFYDDDNKIKDKFKDNYNKFVSINFFSNIGHYLDHCRYWLNWTQLDTSRDDGKYFNNIYTQHFNLKKYDFFALNVYKFVLNLFRIKDYNSITNHNNICMKITKLDMDYIFSHNFKKLYKEYNEKYKNAIKIIYLIKCYKI